MAQKLWEKNVQVNAEIDRFTVGRDREMDMYLAKVRRVGFDGAYYHVGKYRPADLGRTEDFAGRTEKYIRFRRTRGVVIEDGIEDVHSQVELMLTRRLGDVGKKIHSGRFAQ